MIVNKECAGMSNESFKTSKRDELVRGRARHDEVPGDANI